MPQRATGAFFVDFLGGMMNTYNNLTNLVGRLPGAKSPSPDASDNPHLDWCAPPRAVLVSSHFDSAPGSNAASDATQNIAMMLEMLRNLLHREPLPVDTIWNFNGGEETFMQAAHGFITSHPWARHVCAVVNLESLGGGGRELLFQSGPLHGWIVEAYASAAVRPHGSSIVQAVFQSGVVPGETDYKIYRDFGGVPGIDFAVTGNGWVYHTSGDAMPALRAGRGSLQRYGDHMLALVSELGRRLPHVGPRDVERVICFFDLLGMVMVTYDAVRGQPLHVVAVLVLAASLLSWPSGRQLAGRRAVLAALALLWAEVVTIVSGAAVGGLLFLSGAGMPWYGRPLLLVPMLIAPVLTASLECSRRIIRSFREEEVQAAAMLVPGALLGLFTALPSPTVNAMTYLPLVLLLSPLLLAWPAIKLAKRAAPLIWIAGYLLPWTCLLQLIILGLEVFLPITGRSGLVVPGGVILGAFCGFSVGVVVLLSAPVVARVAPSHLMLAERALLVFAALAILPAVAVPGIFRAFDSAHPKRLFLQHFSQAFHEASVPVMDVSGGPDLLDVSEAVQNRSWIWLVPTDSEGLTPVSGFDFFGAANRSSSRVTMENWPSVYAQLPYIMPLKFMMPPASGGLLEAGMPALPPEYPPLTVALAAQQLPHGWVRLHVTLAAGAPQLTAAVPSRGLRAWSFGTLPRPRMDCDCHYVLHGMGGQPRPPARTWQFWLDVERSWAAREPYALEVYGHWSEGPTPELKALLAELPDFISPVAWPTMWASVRLTW